MHTLCRWGYSLLLAVLSPLIIGFIGYKNRGQRTPVKHRMRDRLGWVQPPQENVDYLFHCVSVGEVVSASSVINAMLKTHPNTHFTVSTTTSTGAERVRTLFPKNVQHIYLPLDFSFAMNTMLRRVRPKKVVITEVELWPNLIHCCWKKNIPVCVLNARMTDKSANTYAKFPALFSPMLNKLSHVCAQGERDYNNYKRLGIQPRRLTLTNNIKFDQASTLLQNSNAHFMNLSKGMRLVVVGGSTHEGEEAALLDACSQFSSFEGLLLILVPRHPQRFDDVADLLDTHQVNWVRSSQASHVDQSNQVILVDEMGKLNQVYAIGDVAFVGGSLANKGGHNALEPAVAGLPIIMGPHTYNNPMICETLQASGALTLVSDETSLIQSLSLLLNSEHTRLQQGDAGRAIVLKNKGAVAQTMTILNSL